MPVESKQLERFAGPQWWNASPTQLGLQMAPVPGMAFGPTGKSFREAFNAWIERNPNIYKDLMDFGANALRGAGATGVNFDEYALDQLAMAKEIFKSQKPIAGLAEYPQPGRFLRSYLWRGPDLEPVGTMEIVKGRDFRGIRPISPHISNLAVDRSKGLIASKAAMEMLTEALKQDVNPLESSFSEHSRALMRHLWDMARKTGK